MELFMITVTGLEVKSDWRAVRDRLLDEFADVSDVLPTTIAGTLLITHEGEAQADGWLESIAGAMLARRHTADARRRNRAS